MNNQQAFDKMVIHLRQQGQRAYDPSTNMCLYRGPNGTKCAVGALIPDEQYTPDLEHAELEDDKFQDIFPELSAHFLRVAQIRLHDRFGQAVSDITFNDWLETQAADFATQFNLKVPAHA